MGAYGGPLLQSRAGPSLVLMREQLENNDLCRTIDDPFVWPSSPNPGSWTQGGLARSSRRRRAGGNSAKSNQSSLCGKL